VRMCLYVRKDLRQTLVNSSLPFIDYICRARDGIWLWVHDAEGDGGQQAPSVFHSQIPDCAQTLPILCVASPESPRRYFWNQTPWEARQG